MLRGRRVRGIDIEAAHMPRSGDYIVYYDGHFVALQIRDVARIIDRDTVRVLETTMDLVPFSVSFRCLRAACCAPTTVHKERRTRAFPGRMRSARGGDAVIGGRSNSSLTAGSICLPPVCIFCARRLRVSTVGARSNILRRYGCPQAPLCAVVRAWCVTGCP